MPDMLYVAARRVLLDAIFALEEQRDALVLVGAQAVYVHAREADLAVAPYTTDGDVAIHPEKLADSPELATTLRGAGFTPDPVTVGSWLKAATGLADSPNVVVDLLVPTSLAGDGRRAARIPPHEHRAARKADGLEGVLVDRAVHTLSALEPTDSRRIDLAVAGPSALIVSKVFKIADRENQPGRLRDKDALDVYRLLRATETTDLAFGFARMGGDPTSSEVMKRAVAQLPRMFGNPRGEGCAMANRACGGGADGAEVAAALSALTHDLLEVLRP